MKKSNANQNSIDLAIFDDETKDGDDGGGECDVNEPFNCTKMKRLIVTLKYFDGLNVVENKNDENIFESFVNDVYRTQLVSDYFHFVTIHKNSWKQIVDGFYSKNNRKCALKNCITSSRYYNKSKIYGKLGLVIDLLDTIHFNVFHMIDSGLRSNIIIDEES